MILNEVVEYMKFRDFELPLIMLGSGIIVSLICWFIYKIATYFEKR